MGWSDASPTAELPARAASATSVAAGIGPERILYAQCWEDADVLVEALGVRAGGTYASVASAGDNSLALLTADPGRVIAFDVNPAQLACVELRIAAYTSLDDEQLLEFFGSRPSSRRDEHYRICRLALRSAATRAFWDRRRSRLALHGLGGVGRFERYFRIFRRVVLPLIHGRRAVRALFEPRSRGERRVFYDEVWNTWRWRTMVGTFFSRGVIGRLGREPAFFTHAEESLADQVLRRSRHAIVELAPTENPYLHWILTGRHGDALPLALRPEGIRAIRRNLERLELRRCSLADFARDARRDGEFVNGFNLSDVFEYMSLREYHDALSDLTAVGAPGARLVYWNMLVPRLRPAGLADRLACRDQLAAELHLRDKAFFYSRLAIEEVR